MARVSVLLLASLFMLACASDVSSGPTTSSRCDTPSLEMALAGGGVAAGSVRSEIVLKNISSRDCELTGYLGLELLNVAGGRLKSRIEQSSTDLFLNTPAPFATVTLPANGHAYAPMRWNDIAEPCVDVYQLRITPPGARDAAVIRVGADAFAHIAICSGGQVTMNPIRAEPY